MTTDILGLDELAQNQASKYLTHNKALRQIEALISRVLDRDNGGPPASPSAGDVYIVDSAAGDWSTADVDDIAHYYSGAWHFYTPVEGLAVWVVDEGLRVYYTGAAWVEYTAAAEPTDFDQDAATTTGLTWGHKAGTVRKDNAVTAVPAGTVTLTDDDTNYVEVDADGTVSANTAGFTSGSIPIREVVTASGAQTGSTDNRAWLAAGFLAAANNLLDVANAGTARTNLGLGTMATQAASAVAITGGAAAGMTVVGFASEYDNGTKSANADIDWSNGNNQKVVLGADITLTFSNMGVGHKQLKVVQDGTGSRTPTLPSGKWPGGTASTFSTGADAVDILSVYYDGSSYYYQLSKGWA